MTWIETIDEHDADGRLRKVYDRVHGPDGTIDNILRAHSLRPHTLEGHMALYKNVLHHRGNALETWLAEAIGVRVSRINGCDYCVEHHAAGLEHAINEPERARRVLDAIEKDSLDAEFDARESEALDYATRLTTRPAGITAEDIDRLRDAGWTDGEILEINQVCAYFAYANRTVLGLGVETTGETLGLSPANRDRPDDWHHR